MAEEDILISYALIYRAPVGTALPSPDTIDYGEAWTAPWENLGYTNAPLTLNRSEEIFAVEVQQLSTPIKRRRTGEAVTAKTVFVEATPDVLELFFAGTTTLTAAGVAVREREDIEFGGQPVIDEYMWGFEGLYVDADGAEWPTRVFFYRATAAPDGDVALDRKGVTGIPIMLTAIPDTSKATGKQLGMFQKVTADITGP
jgi:hypothetical protein